MTEYPDLEDLLASAAAAIGHAPEVGDWGLLESAAARPQASAFGEDAYPTLELKAAALLQSLVGNHALVDGNKRLGWVATLYFLRINGVRVVVEEDEAYDFVIAVASGKLRAVEEIAARIKPWCSEIGGAER